MFRSSVTLMLTTAQWSGKELRSGSDVERKLFVAYFALIPCQYFLRATSVLMSDRPRAAFEPPLFDGEPSCSSVGALPSTSGQIRSSGSRESNL